MAAIVKLPQTQNNEPPLNEGEQLFLTQPAVQMELLQETPCAGTLYLTTNRVIWLSNPTATVTGGYSIDFRAIMCHAIARGGSFDSSSQGCIYCQLDSEDDETRECRFVPADSNALDNMYKAFSEGALRNPDPVQDDDEGEFFFNETEVNNNIAALENAESSFVMPSAQQLDYLLNQNEPGQFDDPPEGNGIEEDGDEDEMNQ